MASELIGLSLEETLLNGGSGHLLTLGHTLCFQPVLNLSNYKISPSA